MTSTVVLVHGAHAESASWDEVADLVLEAARNRAAVPG